MVIEMIKTIKVEGEADDTSMDRMRVTVYIRDVFFYLEGDHTLLQIAKDVSKYRRGGYQYTKAFGKGWDGYIRLFSKSPEGLRIPTGLVCKVLGAWEEKFGDSFIADVTNSTRVKPVPEVTPYFDSMIGLGKLWDHQEEMVQSVLRKTQGSGIYQVSNEDKSFLSAGVGQETSYRLGGMGIWWSATGSGKTESAAALIGRLGVPTLFIVYGNTLVQQTAERFRLRLERWLLNNGIKVGVGVEGSIEKEFVTVAGSSTLLAILKRGGAERDDLLDFMKTRKLLILDEAHGAAANGIQELLELCPAYYRIAMSGTPIERGDGANLMVHASFGEVICRIPNKRMMDEGIIPKTTIYFYKIKGRVKMWQGYRFNDLYSEGIVHYEPRNKKIIECIRDAYFVGKKILVIFKSREHGEILSALLSGKSGTGGFEGVGLASSGEPVPHERVDGRDDLEKRTQVITDFEFGVNNVLLASGIFGVGLDLPQIDVLINAAGSKDVIPVKQRLGRGLRGKKHLEMIDFLDGQFPTLADHSLSRLRIYEGEDCFEIKLKE